MNEKVKQYVDVELKEKEPKTYNACYPRRITQPGGFASSRFFTGTLRHSLSMGLWPEVSMLPHITCYLHTFKQLEMGVPTYFVRSEFAQAVANTSPPEDFSFGDIKWPLDAMLFVLPTDFSLKYFGCLCPYVSICRIPAGEYPKCVKLPQTDFPTSLLNPLRNDADRFTAVYPVYSKDSSVPVDFTGAFNMNHTIADIDPAPEHDATFWEEQVMEHKVEEDSEVPSGEAQTIFQRKVNHFAVKLMLALTARPNMIQPGVMTRKAKIIKQKHPKTVDALWSPNTVGWEYRAVRVDSGNGGGTHASPRMHWRRGHLRNQAYGEKSLLLRKVIWIEPVLIKADV